MEVSKKALFVAAEDAEKILKSVAEGGDIKITLKFNNRENKEAFARIVTVVSEFLKNIRREL